MNEKQIEKQEKNKGIRVKESEQRKKAELRGKVEERHRQMMRETSGEQSETKKVKCV